MNRKHRSGKGILRSTIALVVAFGFMEAVAEPITYTWTGGSGLYMSTPENWDPDGLPINGNIGEVNSGTARINANLYTAPDTAPAELRALTGGEILLAGGISENHNIVMDGGTFGAGGTSWSYAGATLVKSDSNITGMTLTGTLADYDGSNTGTLTKESSGRLTLSGTSAAFSGGIDILVGQLQVSANDATGTGDVTIASGATFNYNTTVSLSSNIVLDGGELFGYFSSALTAPIQVKSDSEIGVGVIYGSINDYASGIGKLTKVASANGNDLRLVAANAFSGGLEVADGAVILEHVDAMSSGTNALSFVSNASDKLLNLGGHSITVSSLSGGPGTGSAMVKSDPYNTVYGAKSWTDATLTVNNVVDCTYAGVFSDGTRDDYGFTRNLNLLKTGTGTLTLTGASSSDWDRGSKTINQGTLVAGHADALGTGGTVTVNNGGTLAIAEGVTFTQPVTFDTGSTLGGNGTYDPSGTVTVVDGMTVAPGMSIGTLTINSDVTFADGSVLEIELGNGTGDLLLVNGDLSVSTGGATGTILRLSGGFSATPILEFTSGSAAFDWVVYNGGAPVTWQDAQEYQAFDLYSIQLEGNSVYFVPEPATLSFFLLSGALLLQRRRASTPLS